MVAIIILLYITTTINFFFNGPILAATNIVGKISLGTVGNFARMTILDPPALALVSIWGWTPMTEIGIGAAGAMSTIVADCTMVCATPVANINVAVVLYQL